MVASNARRRAVRRSAGTPGVVKKAVPTSVAFMIALRIARSSSLRASSTAVGTSGSSAWRLSANCTRIATLASRSQSGWATLSAVHEVECPSTSPRSTASMASFDPLYPITSLNFVPSTLFMTVG